METQLQGGVGAANLILSGGPGIGAGWKQGETRTTPRWGHLLFLAGQVPLALPCQPPGCQVCPGRAIPKLGVHLACWLPFLALDNLVLS